MTEVDSGERARHLRPEESEPPHADPPEETDGAEDRKRGLPAIIELPLLLITALTIAVLVKTFLIQPFYIDSGSMEPTIIPQDRVMAWKSPFDGPEPERGDIIVFPDPRFPAPEETPVEMATRHVAEALGIPIGHDDLIKRVVATGGETLEIRDGFVLIDDSPIDEPYISPGSRMPDFGPVTVPERDVFVMGDNRGNSIDSRRFGPVPVEKVIGVAVVRIWPLDRIGGLSEP
ncbi:MAG: signal peptidase I [Acidimicrobiia bacterium]|nr:signal peptidase I [Acidimicrobiia bacterium]